MARLNQSELNNYTTEQISRYRLQDLVDNDRFNSESQLRAFINDIDRSILELEESNSRRVQSENRKKRLMKARDQEYAAAQKSYQTTQDSNKITTTMYLNSATARFSK